MDVIKTIIVGKDEYVSIVKKVIENKLKKKVIEITIADDGSNAIKATLEPEVLGTEEK